MASKPPTAIKPTTVTMKTLAAEIAGQHNLSKKQSEQVLGEIATLLQEHLKKGSRIKLAGLGVLQVRKRAARTGRNPATGAPIQIGASKKVAFRESKELKEAFAGGAADDGGGSTDW
jgi:DNA-binding protein HU-beta